MIGVIGYAGQDTPCLFILAHLARALPFGPTITRDTASHLPERTCIFAEGTPSHDHRPARRTRLPI